jgi:GH15 family glucan-1,4-alpha-glucosidase
VHRDYYAVCERNGGMSSAVCSGLSFQKAKSVASANGEAMRTESKAAPGGMQDAKRAERTDRRRIEDYALIGDCLSAGLVHRNGSLDWLCWPRFDSSACFAALLGTPAHGCWTIQPAQEVVRVRRRYRPETLILETIFDTATGSVALFDFMPMGQNFSSVIRRIEGRSGRVRMRFLFAPRFDYGRTIPWYAPCPEGAGVSAVAGPDQIVLRGPLALHETRGGLHADFEIAAGEIQRFVASYQASHLPPPPPLDAEIEEARTERYWRAWIARARYQGPWREMVLRSLLVLKALTYAPTGAALAAPTTSLPIELGGTRNWDYRFCWLRDASFAMQALMEAGFEAETKAWIGWLQRSLAGSISQFQIMYGIGGERWLAERELPWLPGYRGSRPVRVGNAASEQVQLDVFGEVIASLHDAAARNLCPLPVAWRLAYGLACRLEQVWDQPDSGVWELRGRPRHYTSSKVMAWFAFDRALRLAALCRVTPPASWRRLRARIHALVCERGFNAGKNSFVQSFGSTAWDGSLLLLPLVGFLPSEDARMRGTLAAIEHGLMDDGLLHRYRASPEGAGYAEGAFLPCNFWLVENLVLQGRAAEAEALFRRLMDLANDVGLLAEQYNTKISAQLGNFPLGFTHLALVRAAFRLEQKPTAAPDAPDAQSKGNIFR